MNQNPLLFILELLMVYEEKKGMFLHVFSKSVNNESKPAAIHIRIVNDI